MNKIEQMNKAVRQSRERHDQIKAEAERKRLALANAIRKTTLEFIYYAGVASSWQVYIAMHPAGISFEVFNEIATEVGVEGSMQVEYL